MADLPKRVALVYDWVNKWGGAEQVLLALHHLFPTAPLYTSVYSKSRATWAQVFPNVYTSFIDRLPLAQSQHELFPWATPLAFESFNFSQYDAVISVTSADAKGIITPPSTFHLCYCLTPTRYLWSHKDDYYHHLPLIIRPFSNPVFKYLSTWDQIASSRPDAYISISQTVHDRLLYYYQVPSTIVYPPVDIASFQTPSSLRSPYQNYFLYVGRLVGYKHPDAVIHAFNQLTEKLVVVGTGERLNSLKKIAKSNITFNGFTSQTELVSLYQQAKGLIFFHEEDFGLVPVEAMAAGIPVIALNRGGATETVIPGVSGLLVESLSSSDLAQKITEFSTYKFDSRQINAWSSTFSQENFYLKFAKVFAHLWKKHKNIYMS